MPPGQVCVFCWSPVTGQGEHVLPRWILRRWKGQGPFVREISGVLVARVDGTPRHRPNMDPVLLPVCPDCNGWLNTTFEQPARSHLRAVLDSLAVLGATETELFVRWWVKTLLLNRHPEAREPYGPRPRPWQLPDGMLPTMRDTERLPGDLSLWMAVLDMNAGSAALTPALHVPLPRTFRADGAGGKGESTLFGIALPNGSQLLFQLVYHPLCDVEHPFEAAGLASRLWPDPPATLDVAAHPMLGPDGYAQLGGLFLGGFAVGLEAGKRLHCPASAEPLDPRCFGLGQVTTHGHAGRQ